MAHSVGVGNSVFTQKQDAEVTKTKAVPPGGTINLESEEEAIQAKVLRITLSGTKSVVQAKYWAKN